MSKSKHQVVHSFAQQEAPRATAPEVQRELACRLADTYVLILKTHGYHWNVEGPNFYALHKMLEEQYRDLFEASDELAERLRALGQYAPGSFAAMRDLTSVKEAGEPPFSGKHIIQDLVQDHTAIAESLRRGIELCEEHDDMATADLLTERLTNHEKFAWMLRSMNV